MSQGVASPSHPDQAPAQPAWRQAASASHRPWPERLLFWAVLALALGLRLWDLQAGGWGAEYYSAAVLSMTQGWRNFLFAAFDPTGFIAVDKPPLALWLQVASVKLLGLNPWGLLLPQALMGTAAVGLLHRLTRRYLGAPAALLAALFLATSPVWLAVNRTNNVDTCLLLALLLAAERLLKAAEGGGRGRLCAAMAWLGLAFNVKMLAAWVVAPVFVLVYWLGARQGWRRRLADLTLAGAVLLATSLPWVLAVDLTPAAQRPYQGSSQGNSALELALGHNALGRFVSQLERKTPGPRVLPGPAGDGAPADQAAPPAGERQRVQKAMSRLFVRQPSGPLRLLSGQLAAQVAWLLPLALLPLLLAGGRGLMTWPLAPPALALLFWAGWALIFGVVYSSLGGIIHYYYLATLAPALAVLAGAGLVWAWRAHGQGGKAAWCLPAGLLACGLWQLHVQASALYGGWPGVARPEAAWLGWLHLALAGGCLAGALALGLARGLRPGLARGALGLGVAALLLAPLAWGLSSVLVPGHGLLPSADLERLLAASRPGERAFLTRLRQASDPSRLVKFLEANHGGERYLLATSTAQLAAPVILASRQPVLAMGGFHGLDPALDAPGLARLVGQGQVRFVMLGDVNFISRRDQAAASGRPLADWVRAHGQAVDPALWRPSQALARLELYDLRPRPAPATPEP